MHAERKVILFKGGLLEKKLQLTDSASFEKGLVQLHYKRVRN